MSSNEITLAMTQELLIKVLQEAKGPLYFGEIKKGIQKCLGPNEKITPTQIREAIGVLKNLEKIGSRKLKDKREIFYLIEKKKPLNS